MPGVQFKVGLLIVAALGIGAGFIFVLGNFSLASGHHLYVDYGYIGNMRPGAPVKVSGIKVGKVEKIEFLGGKFDESVNRRVQVRLKVWVEKRTKDTLRSDAEFFINTAGVLGEQYLEIVPGDDFENPPLAPKSIVRGVDPPRTDLIVSRLYDVLDSFAVLLRDERDLIKNLLKNSSEAIAEVNTLLKDNREELGNLIASSSDLAGEAAGTLKRFNQGLGDPRVIGRTLRNADQLLVNANKSLTELTPPAKRLLGDATRVTKLLNEERVDKAIAVADKAVAVSGKAGKLIDNVDGMVSDMRKGKGTAGALIARDEVYADLREMIRDLKRNPWKFFWKE